LREQFLYVKSAKLAQSETLETRLETRRAPTSYPGRARFARKMSREELAPGPTLLIVYFGHLNFAFQNDKGNFDIQ
jgi:hypothetical protein